MIQCNLLKTKCFIFSCTISEKQYQYRIGLILGSPTASMRRFAATKVVDFTLCVYQVQLHTPDILMIIAIFCVDSSFTKIQCLEAKVFLKFYIEDSISKAKNIAFSMQYSCMYLIFRPCWLVWIRKVLLHFYFQNGSFNFLWTRIRHVPQVEKPRSEILLVCLDIRVKEPTMESLMRKKREYEPPRFMSVSEAATQLLQVISGRGVGDDISGNLVHTGALLLRKKGVQRSLREILSCGFRILFVCSCVSNP